MSVVDVKTALLVDMLQLLNLFEERSGFWNQKGVLLIIIFNGIILSSEIINLFKINIYVNITL
jgi:hypothetical protein